MARRDNANAPWTGDAPPPPSRWTALLPLGLGLALGLGLFVWWMIPKPPPKTRLALIEVTNYGKDYPTLSPAETPPWRELLTDPQQDNEKSLESKDQVRERLATLKNPEPKSPHTLVLVIRCHAAMNAQGGCQLLTGEVGQENHYPMTEFMKDALKCNYQNTLIVADICDLNYAPYLGYIVNPIVAALENDYASIQDELAGRNLWILCAAADGQPSFRDRSGKTLFQEGVVESLRTLYSDNSRDFSVADLSKRVCNHCSSHSRGAQTPILISAPKAQKITNTQETRLAWLGFQRKDWFTAAQTSADAGKAKEEPPKENASKEKARYAFEETWTTIQKPEATNPPSFQWQLFERDPFAWREALAIQALLDLELVDNKNPPALRYFENLKASEPATPGGSKNESVRAWENPEEVLSGDDLQRWRQLRDPLRAYLHTVADWVAWRDLVLRLPREPDEGSKGRNSAIPTEQQLRDASKNLEKISKILKVQAFVDASPDGNTSWLQDVDLNQLDQFQSLNKQLTEELRQSVDRLVRDLTRENEKWSWMLEQQCRVTLQFPLLTPSQREILFQRLKDSANSPKNASIQDWSNKVSNPNVQTRFELFRESMMGLPLEPLLKEPQVKASLDANKPSDMMAWGKTYQATYGAESARTDASEGKVHPLRHWFREALRELPPLTADSKRKRDDRTTPLAAFVPGNPMQKRLSLRKKDPREIWIDLKETQRQGEKLVIQLKNADESCKLRWYIEREGKPLAGVSGLQLFLKSDGNKNEEWKYNQDVNNPTNASPELQLTELELKVQGSLQPEDLGRPSDKIVVQWLEDSEPLSEDRLPILSDEKRLDLVIRPIGGSAIYPNMDGQLTHRFLAMAGYPVEFSVEVRNKRPELRRARVILYEQIGAKKTDLFQSKSIDLSQELDLSQEPKVVEFEKALTKEPPQPSSVGNLRWRVEELDIPASTSDPTRDAAATEAKPKQQWEFRCNFDPINPGKFLEVDNIRNQTAAAINQKYDLPLQMPKDFWDEVPRSKKESPVPVRVRWRAVPRTENRDDYSTLILPPGSKSTESSPQKRPVMAEGSNRFTYEFDLGTYPRAASWNIEYPGSSGSKKPEIEPASLSEIRDDSPLQFQAIDKKDGVVAALETVENGSQRIIFRTRRWDDWDKKGEQKADPTQYEIQGIQLEALSRDGKEGIDGDRGIVPWCLVNLQDNRESTGSFPDRDVLADQLMWEETKIAFAPKIREAKAYLFDDMLMQSGSQQFKLKIGLANPCKTGTWSRTLIFDKDPPERGEVASDSTEWRADAGLRVNVKWPGKPDRGEAGIAEGYLAIRGPQQIAGTEKNIYDFRSKSKLKTIGDFNGDELVFDIQADDVEGLKKEFPKPCELRINVLVVDKAGNFQVEHESLTVKWNPAPANP